LTFIFATRYTVGIPDVLMNIVSNIELHWRSFCLQNVARPFERNTIYSKINIPRMLST